MSGKTRLARVQSGGILAEKQTRMRRIPGDQAVLPSCEALTILSQGAPKSASRGVMSKRRTWAVAFIFAAATPVFAQQPPPAAGRVKVASGEAFIVRGTKNIPAKVGELVYESDSLRTGADGRVGVTLKDDTRVSLGPSSEVRVERFAYAPAEGRLGVVLKFARGVAAYVSGQIAKLAPDAVRLETPAAIVGVRGTSLGIRVGS